MATPTVNVYVRGRVEGKRTYTLAEDEKGKLLQLPGTYYLRYDQHGKQTWQRVGDFTSAPAAKLNLERHLKRVAAAVENDLPVPVPAPPAIASPPRWSFTWMSGEAKERPRAASESVATT